MSDEGFDFRPPPPRREARRFEPPPWERDAFEQMAQEQAERDAAAEAARASALAEQEAARAAEGQAAEGAPEGGQPATAGAAAPEPEPAAIPAGVEAAPQTPAPKAEIDEKQVAMMMLGLRAEEPDALEGVWLVYAGAGALVALIGVASLIWGGAALAKPGLPPVGMLGGVILLGFGLGFLGIGGWLVYKALRQRGVL